MLRIMAERNVAVGLAWVGVATPVLDVERLFQSPGCRTLSGFALFVIDADPGWRPDDSGLTPGYFLQRFQRSSGG